MEPLVSILTPCYNSEKYISYLLESILCQTYPNIEMIIIDDGSIDNTSNIILTYIDKFKLKGYSLNYIYQKNQGQSAAINNGLQYVTGKYLVWPDSDDYYSSDSSIMQLVRGIENAPSNCGVVRGGFELINELDGKLINTKGIYNKNISNNLFYDCIFQTGEFFFCSGAYMINMDILRKNTRFPLYHEKDAGQNWQLLLPIFFSHSCVNLNIPIYNVLYRKDSHSRGQYKGYFNEKKKYLAYENTLIHTIDNIIIYNETDKQDLKNKIKAHYNQIKLNLAYNYDKKKDYQNYFLSLQTKSSQNVKLKNFIKFILSYIPFGWRIIKLK